MTDISGKSMEEIYREEARRYKESIEKERVYSESEDILTGNFDKRESLTVTMPMEEFDKLEKLALSAHTDKLSVEKLQEQLNTAKKVLTEIAEIIDDNIHECNYGCDNSCELNGSLDMYSVENVQSVIDSALAAIGGDDE